MTRICPKCHYIARDHNYSILPKEREMKINGSLLGGGTALGAGIALWTSNFDIYPDLLMLFSILGIVFGLVMLVIYYKRASKACPRCKYDNMPASYEPEGQKIIQEKEFVIKDDSTHICTNCNIKSEHKVESRRYSILVILFGLFTLITDPTALIGAVIILATGIYGLSTSLKKRFKCPHCNNKTAVAKDSAEAKALLEQST